MPDVSPVAAISGRDRILITTCTVLITALAWAYLVHLDDQMASASTSSTDYARMMEAMGMSVDMPWTRADLLFTFAMWAVMMVAMMTGSALPVLLLFAAMRTGRGGNQGRAGAHVRGVPVATLAFALGYLLVWVGFSACAAAAQWGLHESAMLSAAMQTSSSRVAGALLLGAGVYQLTPWKGACLMRCRSPLGFLMTNWHDGAIGALQMGLRHGTYCLGCCWALMCLLFVVGVMNLVWVAALTVFVLLEKVGPAGAIVARVSGAAMIALGILKIAGIA